MAVHPCWKCTAACCLKIMDLHDQVRKKRNSLVIVHVCKPCCSTKFGSFHTSAKGEFEDKVCDYDILWYYPRKQQPPPPPAAIHHCPNHPSYRLTCGIQPSVAGCCTSLPGCTVPPLEKGMERWDPGDICGKKRAMSATRKNWQLWLIGFLLKGIAFRSQLLNLHRVLVPFQWARH